MALNDGKTIVGINCGLHCQWTKKVLISFDRMMLVIRKLIGDSWKTMSKLKNNSQENNLGEGHDRKSISINESKPRAKH